MESPGVYILKSDPLNSLFSERVYIGESEKLGSRLKQHLGNLNKRSFNEFIAFSSSDKLLNKATIKYLESRLVSLAHEAKNAEIENKNAPQIPSLGEADTFSIQGYLKEMKLILPVMGFDFLRPFSGKVEDTTVPSSQIESPLDPTLIFKLKSKRLKAFMIPKDGGILVLKGSQASKSTSATISPGWVKLRQKLLHQHIWIDKGEYYEFVEDAHFKSASAASSAVLGRQSAGPIYWINDQGKTYSEVIAKGL